MKNTIFVLIFFSILGNLYAQETPEETPKSWRENFLFRVSPSVNYFTYGDLGLFEIPYDHGYGISTGIIWNKPISDAFLLRLEGYYEYKTILSYGTSGSNLIKTTFNNQSVGIDIFPLVIKGKGKFEAQISIGGFTKYLLNSDYTTTINDTSINNETTFEFQPFQGGLALGAGFYWRKRLVEIRAYRSASQFVKTNSLQNNITQLKLVIGI